VASQIRPAGLATDPSAAVGERVDVADPGARGQKTQVEKAELEADADVKALEVLHDELRDEYAAEWQRKTAFETRAFAIVAANLAVVTFLLALSDRTGVLQSLRIGLPDKLVTAGLVVNGLSVLSALTSAIPLRYRAIGTEGFTAVLGRITGSERLSQAAVTTQSIKAKVRQLSSAKKANRFKAATSLLAFVAIAVASFMHTLAVFLVL
jgi:hypothetical protein